MKKILLVGEFSPGAAAWSYSNVFKELGHELEMFDVKTSMHDAFSGKIGYGARVAGDYFLNQRLRRVVLRLRPDLVFLAKAENISHKTLRSIKQACNPVLINFYPDNPFVFWNGNSSAHVLRSLPLYDYFLIWSKMLLDPLKSAGAHALYFPFVYDEALFPEQVAITQEDKKRYTSDVCFVGTWDAEREHWLELLVKLKPDIDLALWGNDWNERLRKDSPLRFFYKGKALYELERLKVFRLSKIVLNFIRTQNMTSHNMRTMEVPASRAFLLTERTAEQAQELFVEGSSIACFSSVEELAQKVEYYCLHEKERLAFIESGFAHVQQYGLRPAMKRLLDEVWRSNV
jgi:spore maturation protein CgeB